MKVSGISFVQGRNGYSDPDGRKYGIAIHNTSNDASARDEASYATRRTDGTSSHFYVDGREVIQSLDTSVRAGHAGSTYGNNHAVAVEITGTNGKSRQWWLDNVAWTQLGRVMAQVCRAYGIAVRRATVAEMVRNPTVRAFYSHDDMRRAWGGTTHDDPGPNFPWDRLFQAVNAALNPPKPAPTPAAKPTRKDDNMLMLKLPNDKTIWLSRDYGSGPERVALVASDEMPSGVPVITVKDEARMTLLGGPVRTAPTS
ncbi:N-acetylmuramoyl-L-alanine amidase [Micromonospora zhanjiangensis]|uniref:N-acetylmuramoyl-L-alanine amidase n=1 Tax=Micromonospora zhanjiangensis TaxID=1522057 RepID=A0ABV8KNR0_9ACTN